jgi:hypothetical protein
LQVVNFVCWYGVWQNAKTNGILFFMIGMVWSRTSDTYSLYFYDVNQLMVHFAFSFWTINILAADALSIFYLQIHLSHLIHKQLYMDIFFGSWFISWPSSSVVARSSPPVQCLSGWMGDFWTSRYKFAGNIR